MPAGAGVAVGVDSTWLPPAAVGVAGAAVIAVGSTCAPVGVAAEAAATAAMPSNQAEIKGFHGALIVTTSKVSPPLLLTAMAPAMARASGRPPGPAPSRLPVLPSARPWAPSGPPLGL